MVGGNRLRRGERVGSFFKTIQVNRNGVGDVRVSCVQSSEVTISHSEM